jgi:hypothetical protein
MATLTSSGGRALAFAPGRSPNGRLDLWLDPHWPIRRRSFCEFVNERGHSLETLPDVECRYTRNAEARVDGRKDEAVARQNSIREQIRTSGWKQYLIQPAL